MRDSLKEYFNRHLYTRGSDSDTYSTSFYFAGRFALKCVLQALNLPKGSEVAVAGFTCEAVILPIIESGLKPLYIDIGPKDFSLNIDDLQRKYYANVKVVILQHSFGIVPVHREAICAFAVTHNMWIIEDFAHGFTPDTLHAPHTQKSCALLSFGRSKFVSSVFGASITTANSELARRLAQIEKSLPEAPKGITLRCLLYKVLTPAIKSLYPWGIGKPLHKAIGVFGIFPREISQKEKEGAYDSCYEFTYPEVLAHTLHTQIRRIPQLLKTIQKRGEEYQNRLGPTPYPSYPLNRYPLLVEKSQRPHILRHFRNLGVFLGSWYSQPIGPASVDLPKMQYIPGSCPVAEDACERIINLPLNTTPETGKFIIDKLKAFSHTSN